MPGTNKCKIGGTGCEHKAQCVVFLVDSNLYERDRQSETLIKEKPKSDLILNGDDDVIKDVLYSCRVCASATASQNTNVCGWLTLRQHRAYVNDTKKAIELQEEGFITIPRRDWMADANGIAFPVDELARIMISNKANAVDVKNGYDSKANRVTTNSGRRWCLFKNRLPTGLRGSDDYVSMMKWESHLSKKLGNIVDTDINHGSIALSNLRKYKGLGVPSPLQKMRVSDPSLQWRSSLLDTFQVNHADGEASLSLASKSYNAVIALSDGYKLKMYPGTHHYVSTYKEAIDNKNPTIAGDGYDITLSSLELVVFLTNLVHVGGPSSGSKTDSTGIIGKVHANLGDQFPFFGDNSHNVVSDMSLHYAIASHYTSAFNTEAMNDCNVIKLMLFDRCIQNFKCEEDDEYQETLTSMEVKRGEGVKAFNVSCLCNTEQSPEARVTTIVLNNHVKDVKITHGHIRKHRKYDQKIKN